MSKKIKYLVAPNPLDKNLTKEINGFDESFKKTKTKVIRKPARGDYYQNMQFQFDDGLLVKIVKIEN